LQSLDCLESLALLLQALEERGLELLLPASCHRRWERVHRSQGDDMESMRVGLHPRLGTICIHPAKPFGDTDALVNIVTVWRIVLMDVKGEQR
jgi:hypothetical protein